MASTWEEAVVPALKANNIELIAYLPDGALADLIDLIEDDPAFTTITVEREEAGVGVVSGAWLGHTRGALLCQSSGLATAINALGSLSKPARIPFLGLISRRGSLGEFNLAQVPFGANMDTILTALGFRHQSLDSPADVTRKIDLAAKTAFSTEEPFFMLLDPLLTGAKDEF